MNRNNRFNRGGKRNSRNYKSHNFKPSKYANDVRPEQLSEVDVGITEYLNEHEGFSAVLKARFSDFHVNEINLDGKIAKFSNTSIPAEFATDGHEGSIPEQSPSEDIPQEIWTQIAELTENADKIVEVDVNDIDKSKRADIHNIVRKYYKRKICGSTITKDDRKYIQFKKFNNEGRNDDRFQWPQGGEYIHFLLYKENIDTMEAVLKISDSLRMKSTNFCYGGVKDRRAKTTQWLSVKKVQPWKLLKRTRTLWNVHVGNIVLKEHGLKLGDLVGNRFRMALRNVTVDDDVIDKSMQTLKENGFINYYGLQRFGNDKEVPTYEIGFKLLLGNFKEACQLILKCKKCDNPHLDLTKAKKKYKETQDAAAACKLLDENENRSIEAKLLMGLSKVNKNDYVSALESMPRNMRLMYIHSVQALIWNRIVSKRIKEFGLKPIVGDLVKDSTEDVKKLEESPKNDEVNSEEENEELDESTGSNKEVNGEGENEELDESTEIKKKMKVKIVTESDLDNYTIYDIVLPLPGYDVTYPENCVKDWYKEILESYGLSLEMPKQSVKSYTLSGNYRKIILKVEDLSWKVMKYNDPNDTLIRSDYEEYLGKEEPKNQPEGKYKALILDFTLKSSCYATMVVREILKTDTSANAHAKLNNYHGNVTKQVQMPQIEAIKSLPPDSLLSNPDKFEEFKRSVFGEGDEESSIKRKQDDDTCTIPSKKQKTDEEEIKIKAQASLV